jgi:hypothetical protein
VGKVTRFKPQVGNVKTGQTTGGFTVINPYYYYYYYYYIKDSSIKQTKGVVSFFSINN